MQLLSALFSGFEPNEIFNDIIGGPTISVDMAELVIVFGTLAASIGIMVAFGNWWSR